MNIVIPLAGKDPRFERFGNPKPLIPIGDKPLIKWCTDSLAYPFNQPHKLIFIVLESEDAKYHIETTLKTLYGKSITVLKINPTEGAACSVLKSKEFINTEEELIIYLADIYFKASLEEIITKKGEKIKGFIPTFTSSNKKYSYAVIDETNTVKKVAEKEVISKNASAGFYYFTHGKDFVWAAEQMIAKNKRANDWFYICPAYNELVERGDIIKIIPSDFEFGLGSPEEVEQFRKNKIQGES